MYFYISIKISMFRRTERKMGEVDMSTERKMMEVDKRTERKMMEVDNEQQFNY